MIAQSDPPILPPQMTFALSIRVTPPVFPRSAPPPTQFIPPNNELPLHPAYRPLDRYTGHSAPRIPLVGFLPPPPTPHICPHPPAYTPFPAAAHPARLPNLPPCLNPGRCRFPTATHHARSPTLPPLPTHWMWLVYTATAHPTYSHNLPPCRHPGRGPFPIADHPDRLPNLPPLPTHWTWPCPRRRPPRHLA